MFITPSRFLVIIHFVVSLLMVGCGDDTGSPVEPLKDSGGIQDRMFPDVVLPFADGAGPQDLTLDGALPEDRSSGDLFDDIAKEELLSYPDGVLQDRFTLPDWAEGDLFLPLTDRGYPLEDLSLVDEGELDGASPPWEGQICSVAGAGESNHWDWIELLDLSTVPEIEEALFLEDVKQLEREVVEAFGTETPPLSQSLLHGLTGGDQELPILLVHGAGSDGNRSFIYPMGPGTGLAPALREAGYSVFALTLPHPHDDFRRGAHHVACALERVRAITGAPKVIVVAHSMGCMVARTYLSDLGGEEDIPYQEDVKRVIMLGPPSKGIDYAFRHPSLSLVEYSIGLGMPSPWDKVMVLGVMVDKMEESIYGGAYPGQLQMLWPWVEVYGLSPVEQDWYTTYHGGQGFISHSLGIEAAMEMGGNFMEILESQGIHPDVEVALLAGENPFFGLIPGETTGPSDGLVFVESALSTDGMTSAGAPLIAADTMDINHWDLLWRETAKEWVLEHL